MERKMKKLTRGDKSQLWDIYTDEKICQKAAGYKAACTKALSKAISKKAKSDIVAFYAEKIQNMLAECNEHNSSAVRHNAAVKANETRKNTSSRRASRVCMTVSKRK